MRFITSMKTMLQTVFFLDRKSLPICIAYNLIKQLMNVFYGVYFIRLILAGLETERNFGYILNVLATMFLISILYSQFDQYYRNRYLPIFRLKVDCYVNERIMRRANSIPFDQANSPGELDRYSRLMEHSSEMILQAYESFGTICGLLEAFVMVMYYIIRVDALALVLSAFPLLYSYFLAEKGAELKFEWNRKVASFTRKKEYARRIHYLRKYAAEMRTSKISRVMEGIYQEGLEQTVDACRRDGKKIVKVSFLERFLGDAISMILPLLYIVVRMLWGARYLMGDFIGIAQAITIFSSDVEWMLDTVLECKTAALYVGDYADYLSRGEDSGKEGKAKKKVDGKDGFHIVFDRVRYQYPGSPGEAPGIDGVSVDIRSGERIAVVGRNGAGKTTFVSLLVNLISCSSGRILLNGTDINAYDRRELKSFFGVVCQDYQIYPISVRDNVTMGGSLTDADVRDAIRKVGLGERIPDIDAVIGKEIDDAGLELSGGERQRLALARVVANSFPVVILDEPTSALDALTERSMNQLILEALKNTGRTLIFISHKLSTTKLVDRILVFDGGRIVEDGNHAELMEKRGLYWKMYQEQSSLYKGQLI